MIEAIYEDQLLLAAEAKKKKTKQNNKTVVFKDPAGNLFNVVCDAVG